MAGLIERFACSFPIGARELNLEVLADVNSLHALIAHVLQGILNRFSLRIQHGLLRSDNDFCFHLEIQSPHEALRRQDGGEWDITMREVFQTRLLSGQQFQFK